MRVRTRKEYTVAVHDADDYRVRQVLEAAYTALGLPEYYHRRIFFETEASAKVFARDVLHRLVGYSGFNFYTTDADKKQILPQLGAFAYAAKYDHRIVGEPTIVEHADHLELRCQSEVSGWMETQECVFIDGEQYTRNKKLTSDWFPGAVVSMRVWIRTATSHVIDCGAAARRGNDGFVL